MQYYRTATPGPCNTVDSNKLHRVHDREYLGDGLDLLDRVQD